MVFSTDPKEKWRFLVLKEKDLEPLLFFMKFAVNNIDVNREIKNVVIDVIEDLEQLVFYVEEGKNAESETDVL